MVDKIKTILGQLRAVNKPVWLAALLKMDDLVDRWTLVISAPWINEENRDHEFTQIHALLKSALSQEELISIVRFGIFDKHSHLVRELMSRPTDSKLEEEQLNGNIVHEGIILESNPDLRWANNTNLFTANADPQQI
jgi:hypothetical protein